MPFSRRGFLKALGVGAGAAAAAATPLAPRPAPPAEAAPGPQPPSMAAFLVVPGSIAVHATGYVDCVQGYCGTGLFPHPCPRPNCDGLLHAEGQDVDNGPALMRCDTCFDGPRPAPRMIPNLSSNTQTAHRYRLPRRARSNTRS